MTDHQVYCTICGGPLLDERHLEQDSMGWLNTVILLTTTHETEDGAKPDKYWPPVFAASEYSSHLGRNPPPEAQRLVLRVDARPVGGSEFDLCGSGEKVHAMRVDCGQNYYLYPDQGGTLWLPVHSTCLQLADQFVSSKEASTLALEVLSGDGIFSTRYLWEVLYRRLSGDGSGRAQRDLPEPHHYFGGRACRGVAWEAEGDLEYGALLETNPLEIPDLTTSVLQNLEPAPEKGGGNMSLNENQNPLSQSSVPNRDLSNAGLDCEFTLGQDRWRGALKELFPWLWELDDAMIHEKHQEACWNWELLARQLSQLKIHEPGDTSLRLPPALRDRRRIWRILEEARVDDVARRTMESVARYREEMMKTYGNGALTES